MSVGATARQWVRRAAICQCLACQRGAQKAAPDFWGKGDSVLPERKREIEEEKVSICSATRWVRERRYG